MPLTQERAAYKPFEFPWAYDLWKRQQQVHWMPDEVPLSDDVRDWNSKLTAQERHLLTQIFRFFTQGDIEVNNCYHRHYLKVFKPTEVVMMLTAFANMETIHIAAYSLLLETIGMPPVEYEAFLKYDQMKDKSDYLRTFGVNSPLETATTMSVFGAFTEGLQLFASFAILLNFPRFNKMKGMGQVVTWSARDESLHCEGIIRLYHEWIREQGLVGDSELSRRIRVACEEIVSHEDAFIDLAFELGPVQGITAADVKQYIRYIADKRLEQLGEGKLYGVAINPLPWMDEALNSVERANFFEARPTEYSRAASGGTWDENTFSDAFSDT